MVAAGALTTILGADGRPWQPDQTQLSRLLADGYKSGSYYRRAGALYQPFAGSADRDYLTQQSILISRSRDQYRNNPIARGTINKLTDWTIGDGLQCRPRLNRQTFAEALGWSKEQTKKAQELMRREWLLFAENRECDLERIGPDIYSLQTLAFKSMLQSGDVLTLLPMVKRPGGAFETKIQLVEADRVSNPNNRMDTAQLRGGVQLEKTGAPLSYHVQETHPGEMAQVRNQWKEVLAFGRGTGRINAWLTYERERPAQTRGIPYLASILEQLHQLERYTDAELMAAIVGGSLTVLLKTQGAQGLAPGVRPVAALSQADTQTAMAEYAIDYGAFVRLQPGEEDVSIIDPKRPNRAFGEFIQSLITQAGMGSGIPHEILANRFTVSFSAARAAINEFFRYVRYRRWHFAYMWLAPIYEIVITESVLKGRLVLPGFLDDLLLKYAYLSALWLGPVPGALNPLDEANAAGRRIELGLSSIEREAAEMGNDATEVFEERMDEVQARRAAGLEPVDPTSALLQFRPVAAHNPIGMLDGN